MQTHLILATPFSLLSATIALSARALGVMICGGVSAEGHEVVELCIVNHRFAGE